MLKLLFLLFKNSFLSLCPNKKKIIENKKTKEEKIHICIKPSLELIPFLNILYSKSKLIEYNKDAITIPKMVNNSLQKVTLLLSK